METRRSVYYKGNSVKRDRPDARERRRRRLLVHADAHPLNVIPELDRDRVFLTLECLWCDNVLADPHAVCPHCRNCQWCGLVSDRLDVCRMCGNHEPEQIRPERVRRRAVVIGREARIDTPGQAEPTPRPTSRSGPEKADTRSLRSS